MDSSCKVSKHKEREFSSRETASISFCDSRTEEMKELIWTDSFETPVSKLTQPVAILSGSVFDFSRKVKGVGKMKEHEAQPRDLKCQQQTR
jgi:hypothetical protein